MANNTASRRSKYTIIERAKEGERGGGKDVDGQVIALRQPEGSFYKECLVVGAPATDPPVSCQYGGFRVDISQPNSSMRL